MISVDENVRIGLPDKLYARVGTKTLLCLLTLTGFITANAKDYQLTPQPITEDTYIFEGHNEDFNFNNGGNIVNTGFIITADGVIVINTGPSKLYGEQMRAAIAEITERPVIRVFISKLHPDHYLGNQAFQDVPIATLATTIDGIRLQGDMFTDNMYRMVGHWMQGTEMIIPSEIVTPGKQTIGGHQIELITLRGHTPSDLIVFDHTTGVLFAGGTVFHNRAATTPHADLDLWLNELDQLAQLDFKWLVPSHGPIADNLAPLEQTRAYVAWLRDSLRQAANSGLDMAEVLYLEIPPRFRQLAVMPLEFQRSVSHLYPTIEASTFSVVGGATN